MSKRTATPIGANVRTYRHRMGISQDALSKRADLTVITVINVESGKTANPTISTVKKIARALQVSLDDLVE